MTVIAYKNHEMACDSLCADINTGNIWYKGNKITRTKAGALVGCSGAADARALIALLQNVKNGKQMPTAAQLCETKVETENGVLIALPNGEVWCITITFDPEGQEWSSDCCAITGLGGVAVAGCGGHYALAAMKAGKSARQAVAIACELNSFCSPPIYVEKLHPPKKPRVRRPRSKKPA